MLLHAAAQISTTNFSVHPSTVVGLVAFGALYWWRASQGELEGQQGSPTAIQRVSFFSALVILFLSLNGPLHDLSDYYLFSAHMVQHLILTLIVPPLMIYGTPGWMLKPLIRNQRVYRLARANTSAVACFAWFNIVLAFWHLPPIYNMALKYHPIHVVQHLMFIASSVLMWWPLMSPLPELPRLSYPAQMLYCFLMVIPMAIISIYIALSDTLLYPAYAVAPRILGVTPLDDQQYGGLIMWIPGALFFYGVMTVVFFKWSARGAEDDQAAAQAV